jgi:hypothetical protein
MAPATKTTSARRIPSTFLIGSRSPAHFGCEDHFDVVDTLRIEAVPVQIRLSA